MFLMHGTFPISLWWPSWKTADQMIIRKQSKNLFILQSILSLDWRGSVIKLWAQLNPVERKEYFWDNCKDHCSVEDMVTVKWTRILHGDKDQKVQSIKRIDNNASDPFGNMVNCLNHLHQFYSHFVGKYLQSLGLDSMEQ